MTIPEILNHELLRLPIQWKGRYSTYLEAVKTIGTEYLGLLRKFHDTSIESDIHAREESKSLPDLVANVLDVVIECLETYLRKGSPSDAYDVFHKGFSVEGKSVDRSSPARSLEFQDLPLAGFRLRVSEAELKKIDEIFHVPFDKRHLANAKRYSIPGYPTLYLSNSVYLAFVELGQPPFESLYASRFELPKGGESDRQGLLDLRNHPKVADDPFSTIKFLGRWPLTMACSMVAAHPQSHFKPEYFLPQIILEWTRKRIKIGNEKRRVIGVTYSSSKVPIHKKGYSGLFYNTAIPVDHADDTGYCDSLRNLFQITSPLSFEKALSMEVEAEQGGEVKSILDLWHNEIEYIKTGFGKIETILLNRSISDF